MSEKSTAKKQPETISFTPKRKKRFKENEKQPQQTMFFSLETVSLIQERVLTCNGIRNTLLYK